MDPEVGDRVEESDSGDVEDGGSIVQGGEGDGQANIRDGNEDGLIRTEDGTGGAEVADAQPTSETVNLTLQATLAGGGIEEEVRLPSEELVGEQVDGLGNGGVLEELVKVDATEQGLLGGLGSSGRNEGHVLLHVTGEAVVAVVRELP